MKALTRVEKFQKLRDEISRMPDDSELSSDQKPVGYEIAQTKKSQVSDIKSARSTIGFGIDDIIESVRTLDENERKSVSPIVKQKRKELIQTIILISILILLIVGLIIIGINAF